VGPVGIEPTPLVLQTSVRTSYTKDPILIMLECRLAPILNCLPKFYGAPADGLNFLDPRKVSTPFLLEKLIIIVGSSGLEPLPKGPDLQSGCRIRTTFTTQFFVPREGIEPPPFVCKTNTLPLRHRGKMYVSELPTYKHTN
jgi:hypothetical protein